MIQDFLSFYIVVSKCEEWKEEAFLWSAPGDINIATPPAAVEYMGVGMGWAGWGQGPP